jgi:hypothetical protein
VDIFSRRSGPRDEDKRAKDHLRRNWGTIEKLADQISGGSYSATKSKAAGLAKPPEPSRSGRVFFDQSAPRDAGPPAPYLKISQNGRVVIVDRNTGLQMHFLGQLKRQNGSLCFVIARAENGYITPLEAGLDARIADLAGKAISRDYPEDALARDLASRLNLD